MVIFEGILAFCDDRLTEVSCILWQNMNLNFFMNFKQTCYILLAWQAHLVQEVIMNYRAILDDCKMDAACLLPHRFASLFYIAV